VTIVPAALTGGPGRARFHLSLAGDTSRLHGQRDTVSDVEVEVTTADAVETHTRAGAGAPLPSRS
jgi:hypothetical protein